MSESSQAALATRLARSRARGRSTWLEPSTKIELRRFAGTRRHAERLSTPLRIAHLTDLHVGRVTPMRVQMTAVEMVNERRPDLVCITGDFVCHSQAFLDQLGHVIASIEAPVLGVLGNHDHWSGANAVRRVLRRAGAEVLDNVHTVLELRNERLQVVGLDDAYTGHADWRAATRGMRRDLPTLGLSHIAEESEHLWRAGASLVLSGHTHAGQVTLARLNELAIGRLVGHKYIHGLYGSRDAEDAAGSVYVGAGIGAAVFPLRIGKRARREITLFDLGMEPGSFSEHHEVQTPLKGRPPSPRTKEKRARAVARKRARRIAQGHDD
ncbi:MAG: metallophosphoesterase family protein [Myxococcales bacterium]|nr:metallophosphoesterase family protein [Myxococcales bacterium]MCB9754750.1 metallophosphoesterase family protein [Myxococcales bacterium]